MALKSYALTTVQRAADFIGLGTIAAASTEESVLERLINAATEYVEKYLGYRVKQTTHTDELHESQGGDTIILNNFPVDSVVFTLQRRLSGLNEDDWETIDSSYYHIDYDAGIIYAARGTKFATTRYGYRVSYTAGYVFNNTTTFLSDTEAGDLELAIWLLVASVYGRRRGGGRNTVRKHW